MTTPKLRDQLDSARNTPLDNEQGVTWSFEFFPPKTDAGVANLDARLGRMRGMNPEFVDYTWGAGGSTSELTMELCKTAQNKHNYIANMHLTCTNMEEGKVEAALKAAKENGIRNIIALRGDPPVGEKEWKATDTGFSCALDLVKYIRAHYGDYFCISVAGYPECHPDKIADYDEYLKTGKVDPAVYKAEMDYLKKKVEAGADFIISQMFYDAELFIQWVKDCREAGITVPILPGLLPIQAYAGFKKMTGFCKTYVKPELLAQIEAKKPAADLSDEDKKKAEEEFKAFGIEHMVGVCKALLAGGVKHLHFYCLNVDMATKQVLKGLDLIPQDYDDSTCAKYAEKSPGHRGFLKRE
eukprot:TRINITY_DN743_c2_g1_i2.p1 TRINITY_DN743_c2_g1~~TRINITY_DN743_c2_g1_i2.p1  ORF type:complete len:355 (+),score=118.01 TRINITY_DN743_c2_g1_i2:64-1128(+)